MRIRRNHLLSYLFAPLVAALAFSATAHAQAATPQAASKSSPAPAPKRDLTGVWQLQGIGGRQPYAR